MVILSDNITWLYYQYKENLNATSVSIFISPDQQEIYDQLDLPHDGRPLLVAQETSLAYMAMVYTPLRSYCSHPWNTPYAPQRRASLASYFEGHIDDPLLTRDLLVVVNEQDGPFVFAHRSTLLYTNDSYSLYRVPPITLDDPIQSSRNASQDVTLH